MGPRAAGSRSRFRLEWGLTGVALVAAVFLFLDRGKDAEPGRTVEAVFRLSRSDNRGKACASEFDLDGYRCEYATEDEQWIDPPAQNKRLLPYTALSGALFLLPSLFDEPAVAEWLQRAESGATRSSRRVRARCAVELLDVANAVQVRNRRKGRVHWDGTRGGWAGVVRQCQVTE